MDNLTKNAKPKIEISITCTGMEEYWENKYHRIIKGIQNIIKDELLDDKECFNRIEKIIDLLADEGIDCGFRHDY